MTAVVDIGGDERLLVLAPVGRDGELTCRILREGRIEAVNCVHLDFLCAEIERGAGAIVVAEEALVDDVSLARLAAVVSRQPAWSDLPVLMLTAHGADSRVVARALESLGNVSLLERPLRIGSLVSSVRTAIRARRRQYQIRAHLLERERNGEMLREADRRKDEFLATLAHELRNPLAPISNAAQILQQTTPADATTEWARAVIARQCQHLTRLVDDLLDVSRITRGKLDLRTNRTCLHPILLSAVETSRPLLNAAGHELVLQLSPEPLTLDADPVRLSQVVSNLLNNAAKYTPRGGRVTLLTSREGNEAVIRISDTGTGISAEMLPNIFELFVQGNHSLERTTGGLGIGLTLVRLFVEMHGGSVLASSRGADQGSEFTVRLPLATNCGEFAEPAAEQVPLPSPELRILIADDNRDSAESMRELLLLRGNEVAVAYDGEEALERAVAFSPDVVLLDIGMPKMNGYDVARQLRATSYGRDVMLIAMTGWGHEDDRLRSRTAGFDHHLVKPVDFVQLQKLLADRTRHDTAPASS